MDKLDFKLLSIVHLTLFSAGLLYFILIFTEVIEFIQGEFIPTVLITIYAIGILFYLTLMKEKEIGKKKYQERKTKGK